jgi:hypothetical protein
VDCADLYEPAVERATPFMHTAGLVRRTGIRVRG